MNFGRLPNRLAELEQGQFSNCEISEEQRDDECGHGGGDRAKRNVKENVEAAESITQAMKIKHHRATPSVF